MILFSENEKKVLNDAQQSIAPMLEEFSKTHILVGGTAIALHLFHRKSLDFDFFCFQSQGTGKELFERFRKTKLKIDSGSFFPYLSDEEEPELEFFVNNVKIQILDFSRNPFGISIFIPPAKKVCEGIQTPSLLDLASLKIYAMMYRKKWKDAIDLYFLIQKNHFSFESVLKNTQKIFQQCFVVEAMLETILEDNWDFSETVEYLISKPPQDQEIQNFLIHEVKNFIKNA